MKNKKGFTLIELLAVIVILAIIALIATPIILNTIEKSRKNSAKDSMYGYVEAIESQNALHQLDSEKYQEVTTGDVSSINSTVKVKGTKPTSGTVTIEKGTVTSATLCVNGYTVTYDGKEVINTTKGCNSSQTSQTPWQPSTYFYRDSNHSDLTPTSDVSTLISNNEAYAGKASDESNNNGMWFKRNDQIYSLKAGDASYEQTHVQQIFSDQNELCVSDNSGMHCTSPNIISGLDVTIHVYSSNDNISYSYYYQPSEFNKYYVEVSYDSSGNENVKYQQVEL